MIALRLAVLAGAIGLAGCGANPGSGSETYTVAEVTLAFEREGLPVREFVEGEIPCEEAFGPPEAGEENDGCWSGFSWSGEGPFPGVLLEPLGRRGEWPFVVLVYHDPVPPVDAAPSLSGPHYANVVVGNVLASVFDDELLPQVEAILDDI